jgi:hypothetical protein
MAKVPFTMLLPFQGDFFVPASTKIQKRIRDTYFLS